MKKSCFLLSSSKGMHAAVVGSVWGVILCDMNLYAEAEKGAGAQGQLGRQAQPSEIEA